MTSRRFSPPWTIEETAACFIVRDYDARWMAGSSRLRLQIVRLAKPGRESFRSYPGVVRTICGDDGHMPAGFGIGVYMHLMPFFRQAIPNIISANSSAAILVFCMARFQRSRQTIGQVRVFTNSTVIISLFH